MQVSARSFRDLVVWQRAHAFVLAVYEVTQNFPKSEIFGLASQFRRAAVSIPANIAEGFRKHSALDKKRFYNIAEGSLEECRYYLILSYDLAYIEQGKLWELSEEVGRLLNSFSNAAPAKTQKPPCAEGAKPILNSRF